MGAHGRVVRATIPHPPHPRPPSGSPLCGGADMWADMPALQPWPALSPPSRLALLSAALRWLPSCPCPCGLRTTSACPFCPPRPAPACAPGSARHRRGTHRRSRSRGGSGLMRGAWARGHERGPHLSLALSLLPSARAGRLPAPGTQTARGAHCRHAPAPPPWPPAPARRCLPWPPAAPHLARKLPRARRARRPCRRARHRPRPRPPRAGARPDVCRPGTRRQPRPRPRPRGRAGAPGAGGRPA